MLCLLPVTTRIGNVNTVFNLVSCRMKKTHRWDKDEEQCATSRTFTRIFFFSFFSSLAVFRHISSDLYRVFFESDSHFYVIIIYKSDLYDINVTWIFLNYNYSIIARCWFFVYDLLRAFNRSFLIIKDRINNAIRVCLITNWNGGVFKEIRSLRLNLEINKLLRKIYEKVKIFLKMILELS